MRVLMLSKALLVGHYQTKAEALARIRDVDLTVLCPPSWRDERGTLRLEKRHVDGYRLIVTPLWMNGHYHLHFYPRIGHIMQILQPDLIHLDEEPYNLATFYAIVQARRHAPHARILFFTWQNLQVKYPPPFSWMEAFTYSRSDYALAGSQSAEHVLRSKGFAGPIRVIPQFGVDPETFRPSLSRGQNKNFVVGFAARLVPEKGASLLIEALAKLDGEWELRIVGSGPERKRLDAQARRLQVTGQVSFIPWQNSEQMPEFYKGLDVLVAPSMSRPNWTEQFGRVLIEAMACAVPVIGSSSGEIPNVLGDAGLIFPEGDADELAGALRLLKEDPSRRADLGSRGRARVLDKFKQSRIAEETYAVYRDLLR